MVKNLPAKHKTWVRSRGWEDPPEKEITAHSSILAWEFHGQRSLAGRVRHKPLGGGEDHNVKIFGVGKDRTLDDSRSNSSCEIDEKSKTKQQGY